MLARRRIALWSLSVVLVACNRVDDVHTSTQTRNVANLHAACDRALDTVESSAPDDRRLTVRIQRSLQLGPEVGRIGDVAWNPIDGSLLLLDFSNARIATVGSSGEVVRTFGQAGVGPGDLLFDYMSSTAPARIVALDSFIVVFDERSLKAYSYDGSVLWDRTISSFVRAHRDGMHLSYAGGRLIRFSESGKYRVNETSRLARTAVALRTVHTESGSIKDLFAAENNWALLDSIGSYPSPHPYMSEYRRAWDGDSVRLALYSYRHYGVCFFDTSGNLLSAFKRGIAPYRIDRKEEDRALAAGFGTTNHDLPLPFYRKTARELYTGRWPSHGPRYTDIVVGADGSALLLRRVSAEDVVVDVFSPSSGYLGSFAPPVPELPRRLNGRKALAINREELQVIIFEWSDSSAE